MGRLEEDLKAAATDPRQMTVDECIEEGVRGNHRPAIERWLLHESTAVKGALPAPRIPFEQSCLNAGMHDCPECDAPCESRPDGLHEHCGLVW